MALPYADWDDVVESFEGPLPIERKQWVEVQLRRASARLTRIVPWLPDALAAQQIDPELPLGLVVDAVLALFRNPSGTQQQTAGLFNQSFSGQQEPYIHFDEAHVRQVLALPDDDGPGYGTIQLGIPAYLRGAPLDVEPYRWNPYHLPLP